MKYKIIWIFVVYSNMSSIAIVFSFLKWYQTSALESEQNGYNLLMTLQMYFFDRKLTYFDLYFTEVPL